MKISMFSAVGLTALAVALPLACSKSSSSKDDSSKKSSSLQTEVAASRLAITALTSAKGYKLAASGDDFGVATPDSLTSAKYRVQDITLCETKSATNGDACDGKTIVLYGSQENSDYDTYLSADAAADTTNFIDFLSPTDRAKLTGSVTLTSAHVGEYEAVVVHFYRPFKLTGSVELKSGTKVYTKNSTTFEDNGKTGLDITAQTNITNATTAPAAEGVFFLSNGGKSFKLQKKVVITEADIADGTAFKMVLAFDPDYMLRAANIDAAGLPTDWRDGQVDKTNNYKLSAEFLNFAPVIAKKSETIMRETYILSMGTATGGLEPHDVKLSLYYVKEDTDKAVRAVTANWMYNSSSTQYINSDPLGQIYTVSQNSDGSYDFLSSTGVKLLSSFVRQTTKNAAFSVSSSYCGGSYDATTGCSVTAVSKTYSAELVSDTEVTAEGEIAEAQLTK